MRLSCRPKEQIFRSPPFLAIEILSRDDRAADLQEKLDDYREFDIPFIWVINPGTRSGVTHYFKDGLHVTASGLFTRNPDIDLPAERLFE